jgi:hypothetical protein
MCGVHVDNVLHELQHALAGLSRLHDAPEVAQRILICRRSSDAEREAAATRSTFVRVEYGSERRRPFVLLERRNIRPVFTLRVECRACHDRVKGRGQAQEQKAREQVRQTIGVNCFGARFSCTL